MQLAQVRWIDLPHSDDARGTLTALERPALPYDVKRIFYMHHVPAGHERGTHAHRATQQSIVAVAGSVRLDLSDGERTGTFVLDDPNRGVYVPAMIWVRLYEFSPDAVVLVLCDTVYNPAQVIRTWDDYCLVRREMSLTT